MFKYAGEWHMNVVKDPVGDSKTEEEFSRWLIEAVRFSVEQLGIRDEKVSYVEETIANELKIVKIGKNANIELSSRPTNAISHISLI